MNEVLREAVIVSYGRSPMAKAVKGSFKDMHPVEYGAQVLKSVVNKVPDLNLKEIGDVIVGCSKPELVQGYNIARLTLLRAELPHDIPGVTVNRFCASGLQAISIAANMIKAGETDIVVAGGIESMSKLPMGSDSSTRNEWLVNNNPDAYVSMGITAENVAEKYSVERIDMEKMAVESHNRAYSAQQTGKFKKEIVPIEVTDSNGNVKIVDEDECIRANSNLESLASLKPVFKEDGRVTAATASQMSDAAGFVVLMSREKAEELGVKPIAKFLGYSVTGVDPAFMGIGPIKAVPKVMELTGLKIEDMDTIELNEAFAAQAIPCIKELKFDEKKVNPNGGAIALGHPLGATGVVLTCKALSELERINGKYGLITMCVGGGMGAAGVIEKL